ncbi:MAG: hypothetical protein RL653_1870 [Pseudomonadota bacterium]|jgi:hypothetical protein
MTGTGDAAERELEWKLSGFAGQLEDGVRPDFETRGVPLALEWLRGVDGDGRARVGAILSRWLPSGTVDEARLAARLAPLAHPSPSAVASAWERGDLPAETVEELGYLLRGLLQRGEVPWQPGWRGLLARPGGHAALGGALVADREWALAQLGELVGDRLSTAMQRLLAATAGLNRAEAAATWNDFATRGERLPEPARARCSEMVAWVQAHGEEPEGDGQLRWTRPAGG